MNLVLIRERRVKFIFFILTLLGLLLFVFLDKNMFLTLLISMVTFFLCVPGVDWIERKGIPRKLSAAMPALIAVCAVTFTVSVLTPDLGLQLKNIHSNFPKYIDSFNSFLGRWNQTLSVYFASDNPIDLASYVTPYLTKLSHDIFSQLPNYISRSLTMLLLIPFISYFMLLDGRRFIKNLLSLVPNNFYETTSHLIHEIGDQIGGYIRARLLETFLVFMMIWIGLLIAGFPYAFVLAIFAGVVNIIPYLGPVIGAIPALVIYFAEPQLQSVPFFILIMIYVGAQIVDTILIVPFIVAKIVDQHPVTVVLSVIVGSQLLGVLGMIISIPIYSVIRVTYLTFYRHFTDYRV